MAPSDSSNRVWIVLLLLLMLGLAAAAWHFRGTLAGHSTRSQMSSNDTSAVAPAVAVATEPAPALAPPRAEPARIILAANFDKGDEGFVFVRDAFRKTAQPKYSEGAYAKKGGVAGGALSVHLGGRDSNSILGMSGGWQKIFVLSKPERLGLTFSIKVTQSSEYEDDEFSQAMVTVDGTALAGAGRDYLAQVRGDGNGGPEISTGWKTFTFDLGELSAGQHMLTLGAYNNKKTATNEFTDALIDDVKIQTGVVQSKMPSFNSLPSVQSVRKPEQKYFKQKEPDASNLDF